MRKKTKYTNILIVLGVIFMLVLFLTASYAYFAITSINNATATTITGNGENLGTPILTTSDSASSLGLNLTTTMMSEEKIGYKYYATPDSVGVGFDEEGFPTVGNGKYELATVSLDRGVPLDCNFTYTISATTTKSLGEDSKNVYVIITDGDGIKTTYTLYQLLSGVTYTGNASYLIPNQDQGVYIESYVENTSTAQSNLKGAKYTITITPKSGTQGFKCNAANKDIITSKSMAANYEQYGLWNTGLEDDGYRYTGTGSGEYCIYNDGEYIRTVNNNACPSVNKVTRTVIATNVTTEYYTTSTCPTTSSTYKYECQPLTAVKGNKVPNNYMCFGTTNKTECTNNPDKYMYRIIGILPDDVGTPHIKLLKATTIGNYEWDDTGSDAALWNRSSLYKGLNGSYFYTNTTYDYMQNSTWKNKITDWIWTSVNVGNDDYYSGDLYYDLDANEVYLHELNKSTKTETIGSWTYNKAKIGLINVSDFLLSYYRGFNINIGDTAFKNSWLHFQNNGQSSGFSWTISAHSNYDSTTYNNASSFAVYGMGSLGPEPISTSSLVYPVFYLNSNIIIESGSGTSADPYILNI